MYGEHISYLANHIQKSFKMIMLAYTERVCETFESVFYMPLISKNSDELYEAGLVIRDVPHE